VRAALIIWFVAAVISAVVFWFAPLLGAIMMIGVFGGLFFSVLPALFQRIAELLSGAPFRRR
jgi:hypothetical protein